MQMGLLQFLNVASTTVVVMAALLVFGRSLPLVLLALTVASSIHAWVIARPQQRESRPDGADEPLETARKRLTRAIGTIAAE